MELLVCMLLASIVTSVRPVADLLHLARGVDPPHLRKAQMREQRKADALAVKRAKVAAVKRPVIGSEKPRLRDLARVYWGDAIADVLAHHERVRQEKQAGTRPTLPQRTKRLGKLLWEPVGEKPVRQPGQNEPSTADVPFGEPEPVPVHSGRGVVHDSNEYKMAQNFCWECKKCGAVGLDLPTHEAAVAASGQHHCNPNRPPDEARQRLQQAVRARGIKPLPDARPRQGRPKTKAATRNEAEELVTAAKDAFERGNWRAAAIAWDELEERYPSAYEQWWFTSQHDPDRADMTTRNWHYEAWKRAGLPTPTPAITEDMVEDTTDSPQPSNGGTTMGQPTGEAVNYETTVNELNEIAAAQRTHIDLTAAAVEAVRQAKAAINDAQQSYTPAAQAAGSVHEHLAALNLDAETLGHTGTTADAMPPNAVDRMFDELEAMEAAAQEQHANAETALASTEAALRTVMEKYGDAHATVAGELGGNAAFLDPAAGISPGGAGSSVPASAASGGSGPAARTGSGAASRPAAGPVRTPATGTNASGPGVVREFHGPVDARGANFGQSGTAVPAGAGHGSGKVTNQFNGPVRKD